LLITPGRTWRSARPGSCHGKITAVYKYRLHPSWGLSGSPLFPTFRGLERSFVEREEARSETRLALRSLCSSVQCLCHTCCSSSWRPHSPDSLLSILHVVLLPLTTLHLHAELLNRHIPPLPPPRKSWLWVRTAPFYAHLRSLVQIGPPPSPPAPLSRPSYPSPELDLDLLYSIDHLRYSHLVQFRCAFPVTRQDGSNLPLDQWQRQRRRPPEDLGRHILTLRPVHHHHPNAQSR
jgi:hypothetical protein